MDMPIYVPFPPAGDLQLRIATGASRLRITPGGDAWVAGTYSDPTGKRPLKLVQEGGNVTVTQNRPEVALELLSGVPRYDLTLGTARPFALTVEVGVTDDELDLGGVPLTRLDVRQGAGVFRLGFSAPNPEPMRELKIGVGATRAEFTGLGNANAAAITVEGGAAACVVDFGGTLQRDAAVRLSTGVSAVEVRVGAAIAAKITPEAPLGMVDAGEAFQRQDGALWNSAAVAGQRPELRISASVALGQLRLRQSG